MFQQIVNRLIHNGSGDSLLDDNEDDGHKDQEAPPDRSLKHRHSFHKAISRHPLQKHNTGLMRQLPRRFWRRPGLFIGLAIDGVAISIAGPMRRNHRFMPRIFAHTDIFLRFCLFQSSHSTGTILRKAEKHAYRHIICAQYQHRPTEYMKKIHRPTILLLHYTAIGQQAQS